MTIGTKDLYQDEMCHIENFDGSAGEGFVRGISSMWIQQPKSSRGVSSSQGGVYLANQRQGNHVACLYGVETRLFLNEVLTSEGKHSGITRETTLRPDSENQTERSKRNYLFDLPRRTTRKRESRKTLGA